MKRRNRRRNLIDCVRGAVWADLSVGSWKRAAADRPRFPIAAREYALAETHRWNFETALPLHLRGIALDPDAATGYEYLGWYFAAQGRTEEALRLFRLARRLPGASATPRNSDELNGALGGSNP